MLFQMQEIRQFGKIFKLPRDINLHRCDICSHLLCGANCISSDFLAIHDNELSFAQAAVPWNVKKNLEFSNKLKYCIILMTKLTIA